MRRFSAALGWLALLPTAATGCGAAATDVRPRSEPTGGSSSTATATADRTTAENLTFTGAVSGTMRKATAGSVYTCLITPGKALLVGPITGDVDGRNYDVQFKMVFGYHGAGSYLLAPDPHSGGAVNNIILQVSPTGQDDLYSVASAGTLTVDGERTGTMDVTLAGKLGQIHLSGSWTCPPDS
ncbi:hypothetical protein [Gandjariella thermophila]|uniref:Lipoprotein n=1 Tax=Gandjariella thermophila TaxID=1931992 RepID=A0A4D4IZS4_9PSEU|nr:hypothetical protein [Gandjariella thermophila]GDY28604.1 hypothetical protein GTS_02370 [Gandjariella thermophila]